MDLLIEGQFYTDQGFCNEFISMVWQELQRRKRVAKAAFPINVAGTHVQSSGDWREVPEHWFLTLLSLGPKYNGWADLQADYIEQGRLFEELVALALPGLFANWEIRVLGWSGDQPRELPEVVQDLAAELHCDFDQTEMSHWAGQSPKDAGTDIAWFLPFHDGRGAFPVYLGQCATGMNWPEKIHEPDLKVWGKLVSFVAEPRQGFLIPHILSDREFDRRANQVRGVLLDRLRILAGASDNSNWCPEPLRDEIRVWVEPRLTWLLSPA